VSRGTSDSIARTQYASVVLAAGEGRRAGGYKPLWRVDGGVVIDRVIEAAASVCTRIRIVGGHAFDRLRAHVEALENEKIELVYNAQWERGMFSSVQLGLEGVETPVFIHPADVFGVSSRVYARLAAEVRDLHSTPVLRPRFGLRAGHPVLLLPSAVKAVREARGDTILSEVLDRFENKLDVPVDDEFVLEDFDTANEFEVLRKRVRVQGERGGR
jgi:molybdenum cofactor cytidylyltransferase